MMPLRVSPSPRRFLFFCKTRKHIADNDAEEGGDGLPAERIHDAKNERERQDEGDRKELDQPRVDRRLLLDDEIEDPAEPSRHDDGPDDRNPYLIHDDPRMFRDSQNHFCFAQALLYDTAAILSKVPWR